MDEVDQLNGALSGRYEIEREIGRGGMATVYVARDVRHSRRVALKLFDPDLAATLGAARFLAEIRITANLQHPNVLPLFDSGEADGSLWYVMPYVEGESLRCRLDREKRLPILDAMRIAAGIASALDYAHRHGVVHRDIKPENVLLSDGVPVVADFGIAKAITSSRLDTETRGHTLTQIGETVGTPSYMSPEQAFGDSTVDGRSDVYALGCLLYEMLVGDQPFTGPTAHAVIAKHIATPAPSARALRDTVPPAVDAAISRAMAKDPTERFPTPADFAAALSAAPAVEPLPDYSRIAEPVARTEAPLAGRRKELAQLLSRLDALAQGKGGLVLIGGEPGVGKTRLTEEVLLEARRRGYVCLVGHSYEMEGGMPYQPFVEHLEYTSRTVPPGRFRAALGNGAAEIARVMPALRQLFPDIAEPLDLPADQQRHFLFTRFREYMERGASHVPIVMLLDDLHWADDSTLMLLEHLTPHIASTQILALGTYRDVELDVARPFAKSLERLTRQRLAERITLRRMSEPDVAEMLAILGAPEPPAALVDAIYKETEGNAFFVEEVFRHLKEEGRLLDANGAWLANLEIGDLDVPEGVRLVIGRRLERVGDACRNVLAAAAVVGPKFDLRVLEALGEGNSDSMLDALERAEAAGLILSRPVGRETLYTFAHELIRQTLLASLSMPRRQRWHQRTADAIEKAYAGKLDSHVADIAYHLFQAGAAVNADRATDYLLRAGQQALAAGAFDEALSQVEKGLSTLETQGHRQHGLLLYVRGEAARGRGRWNDATRDFDSALEMLDRAGARDDLVRLCLTMSDMLSWSLADFQRLTDVMSRAMAIVPDDPTATRARVLSRAGHSTTLSNGYEQGRAMVEEAIRIARGLADEVLYADCVGIRGAMHYNHGCTTDAIVDLGESYRIFAGAGLRWNEARFGSLLAAAYFNAGQLEQSQSIAERVVPSAREIGHVGALGLCEWELGLMRWVREPNLDAMERLGRHGLQAWEGVALFREIAKWFLAVVDNERGGDQALTILRGSNAIEPWQDIHVAWREAYWANYFLLAAYADPSRALREYEQREHRQSVAGRPGFGGAWLGLPSVVEGLAAMGERAHAAALYPACLHAIQLGNRMWEDALLENAAGIAATSLGQWDTAEIQFANALRTADETSHVPGQADVRRWHAWMLSQRRAPGDVERARVLLDEAIAINQRIGLPRRVRLCEELRQRLGG